MKEQKLLKFESFFSSSEKESNPFHLNPKEFLKNHKKQFTKLQKALRKINFNYIGEFIVDLSMPGNVGGYFSPDLNVIAISPFVLLQGSEEQIAHILFHEGLHAGVYGQQILEESVTESLTKKKMEELYGKTEFKSGYDELVQNLDELMGDLSYSEMSKQIENGDEATFNNFLQVMVTDPAHNEGDIEALSWEEIIKKLRSKWSILQKLFPRMLNSISRRSRGLHDPTNVSLAEFKLDQVLEQSAKKLLSGNPELLQEIFEKISNQNEVELSEKSIKKALYEFGFGYLVDTDDWLLTKHLKSFLIKKASETLETTTIDFSFLEKRSIAA